MESGIRLIQSVQRCCDIMECFSYDQTALSLNELSEKVELNINTCRGLVQTLVSNGYMERNADGTYSLGMLFIPKAELVSQRGLERIISIAEPRMQEITKQLGAATMLQVISGLHIFTVKSVDPIDSHYILVAKADTRFSCNATASGKLLLLYCSEEERRILLSQLDRKKYTEYTLTHDEEIFAEIERTRQRGYSTEFEEINYGVNSIAVPIVRDDKLFGTISIVLAGTRVRTIEKRAVRMLTDCAMYISQNL